jgi:hypothetical protein
MANYPLPGSNTLPSLFIGLLHLLKWHQFAMATIEVEPKHEFYSVGIFEEDIKGWYHAWRNTACSWGDRDGGNRTWLQYRAVLCYKPDLPDQVCFAVDGLGRHKRPKAPFECTINPVSGKFERLCVQTKDSFCELGESTWDRTFIRNAAPYLCRIATLAFRGVPVKRRDSPESWNGADRVSILVRWVTSAFGISIIVSESCQTLIHHKY